MMMKLPADICLILFDLVDPLDILSIGQTCRILRELSSMRFVWIKALHRVVKANSLFEPVFNYEDESVPLQRLQHAATSPRRMLTLLDRNQKKPEQDREMDPFSMTTIPFLDIDMYTMGPRGRKARPLQEILVPGGRFVLVLSISFSRLTVIDVERYFHLKSKGEENPSLGDYTASAHCQCTQDDDLFRANISSDGHTLLIIQFQSRTDGSDTRFTLWKYDPASNELSLESSVDIQTDRLLGIETHYMSSTLFIFVADEMLFIWDFVNDRYIRWVVDYNFLCTIQVFTDGTRIILLEVTRVQVWDIPPLVSGPLTNKRVPSIQYPPTLSFPTAMSRAPLPIRENEGLVIPRNDWYNGPGPKHPLLFDTMLWRDVDGNLGRLEYILVRQQFNISRLSEGHETSTSNNVRTRITYTRLQSLGVNDDMHNSHILSSIMCEDRIITIACSAASFFVMSTPGYLEHPPLTEPNEVLPNELVSLGYHQPKFEFWEGKFDPCSGRLLQVPWDGLSIIISDYLRAPPLVG